MVGFTNYMKSKASDLKLHKPGAKKDHDGKSEESTLVHKALVAYYNDNNLQLPEWLHHSHRTSKSYNVHSRESSGSSIPARATIDPSSSPQQRQQRQQVEVSPRPQPQTMNVQNKQYSSQRQTSVQSMGDMRRVSDGTGGYASSSMDRHRNFSGTSGSFQPVARSQTITGVPLPPQDASKATGKSRRRFG